MSYPAKRDCGVSQRAKEHDHELNELNTGQHEGTAIADVLGETAHEKHSCHR